MHLGCNSTHHREPEIIHQLNASWLHYVPICLPNLSPLSSQRQKAAAKHFFKRWVLLLMGVQSCSTIEELHWKWPKSKTAWLLVKLNLNLFLQNCIGMFQTHANCLDSASKASYITDNNVEHQGQDRFQINRKIHNSKLEAHCPH